MQFHIHDDYRDMFRGMCWRDRGGWAVEKVEGKFWLNILRILIHTDIKNTFFRNYDRLHGRHNMMNEFANAAAKELADNIDGEIIKALINETKQ